MAKTGSSFKNKVEEYFSAFSSTYDKTMHERPRLVLARLKTLLDGIELPENPVCLDVACGTGISTIGLAEKCRGSATIWGIDISEKMIDEANKTVQRLRLGNIRYRVMDAESLGFPGSTFDFVLCNMSIEYFSDKLRALSEMSRVLKKGGQFALSYTGGPNNQEGFDIARAVAIRHPELPELQRTVEERANLISLEKSIELFDQAGLSLTSIYGRHSIDWVDPSSLVSEQSNYWAIYRQALPQEKVELIRSELIEAARLVSVPDKGLKNTVYVIFAWGVREE